MRPSFITPGTDNMQRARSTFVTRLFNDNARCMRNSLLSLKPLKQCSKCQVWEISCQKLTRMAWISTSSPERLAKSTRIQSVLMLIRVIYVSAARMSMALHWLLKGINLSPRRNNLTASLRHHMVRKSQSLVLRKQACRVAGPRGARQRPQVWARTCQGNTPSHLDSFEAQNYTSNRSNLS